MRQKGRWRAREESREGKVKWERGGGHLQPQVSRVDGNTPGQFNAVLECQRSK